MLPIPKRGIRSRSKPWQILHSGCGGKGQSRILMLQVLHAHSFDLLPSDGALSFCHDWYFSSRFEAEMLWMSWMMNSLLLSRSQSPTPRGSARAWAQGRHQHWRPNRRASSSTGAMAIWSILAMHLVGTFRISVSGRGSAIRM